MSRRSILILGILLASLALSTGLGAASWSGTIELWDFPTWRGPDDDPYYWIKTQIEEFEKENPGVKINLRELPWSGGDETLDTAVASGRFPDITRGPLKIHYIQQGVLEPISPYLTDEDFADYYVNALESVRVNGEYYAFPFYMTSRVVLYNRDYFQQQGAVEPVNGYWTWDEFVNALKKVTFTKEDGTKVWGLAYNAMPPINRDIWPFFYRTGGRLFSEDMSELVFNSPEVVEGLQDVIDLDQVENVVLPRTAGYGEASILQAFRDGYVSVVILGSYAVTAVPQINAGVAYYPMSEDGSIYNTTAVSGYQVFKQTDAGKRDMIMKFLRQITNTEQQLKIKDYGQFPTRASASHLYDDSPDLKLINEGVVHAIPDPIHPAFAQIIEAFSREVQLALLGRKSVEEAVSAAYRTASRYMR